MLTCVKSFCVGLQMGKLLRNRSLFTFSAFYSGQRKEEPRDSYMCRRKRKAALRGRRGDFIGADEKNQARKMGKNVSFTTGKWNCKHCVLTNPKFYTFNTTLLNRMHKVVHLKISCSFFFLNVVQKHCC